MQSHGEAGNRKGFGERKGMRGVGGGYIEEKIKKEKIGRRWLLAGTA